MKKIGVYLLCGIGALSWLVAPAQDLEEMALTFSRTNLGGSARILGLGGTQVSLGGDFSSATSNPAGLGMFNRSEFTISPSFLFASRRAKYFNDSISQMKTKLAIPSMSYIINMGRDHGKWLGGTLAITVTRLNDFNSTVKYEGINPNNSIGDYFAVSADGTDPKDFERSKYNSLNRLAYNTYFIDTLKYNNFLYYISPVGINFFDDTDVPRSFQSETIETSGKQNQWTVSYGTNFDDRFYFGASVHLRRISYENKRTYTETAYHFVKAPSYDPINEFKLEETLNINGSGISATLGAIIRPIDVLQIGLSYNTPTSYYLNESYRASMTVDYDNFDYYGDGSVILDGIADDDPIDVTDEYRLQTPGKLSGGATFFFGKFGLVSAEVNSVNYSKAKYFARSGADNSFDNENLRIDTLYKRTINFNLGGEFRVKNFRLRTGFGYQSDPYVTQKNNTSSGAFNISFGAGVRKEKIFFDVALVLRTWKDTYKPYTTFGYSTDPLVKITAFSPSLNFTVGFPFSR